VSSEIRDRRSSALVKEDRMASQPLSGQELLTVIGDPPAKKPTLVERILIALFVGRARKQEGQPMDVEGARKSGARIEAGMKPARGVTRTEEVIAGVPVVRSSSGNAARGTVLYFHGGAYVTGTAFGTGVPAAADGGPDVVSVAYRKAPEYAYPAAQDDALAVYQALLGEVGPSRLMVLGDSAGGGLLLTLLQGVAAAGLSMPAAAVPIYPWGDLSMSGASWTGNKERDILVHSQISTCARWYAGDLDLGDPLVSPLFGSFEGFPPTYMVVGTRDLLLDDARALESRMKKAGVPVRLDIFPDAPHGFNGVPTRAGKDCNARIRRFIDAVLPPVR
jgi:monoterpene epsilon-lactone hydrolase